MISRTKDGVYLLVHFSEIPGWMIGMILEFVRPNISSLKNIKLGLRR